MLSPSKLRGKAVTEFFQCLFESTESFLLHLRVKSFAALAREIEGLKLRGSGTSVVAVDDSPKIEHAFTPIGKFIYAYTEGMTDQKSDYSRCWANCLGGCNGGMSREHIVSKCLYGKNVKVRGLPWCKDDWAFRSIDNLTSKILCRHHNSELSTLDDAARATLDTIIDAFALWNARAKIRSRKWTVRHFETNMLLLERWCLKTLINTNLKLKPGWPVNGDSPNPTDQLVRVAFGMERFKRPLGLYLVGSEKPEQRTVNLEESEITVVIETVNNRLSGAAFDMWGLTFLLNLHPEERTMKKGGRLMGRNGMDQKFQTHDDKGRLVLSHVLTYTY